MLIAYLRAAGQLTDPNVMRILVRAVVLSALVFAAVWAGIALLLGLTEVTTFFLLEKVLDVLGGAAAIASAFFLFPIVVSAFIGFYLEAVAAAVEARHYPDLPPPKGVGIFTGLVATLRFFLKALVVNLVLLLFLFIPVLYPFAWFAGNSYLLGREYFELVALRRLQPHDVRELRRRRRLSVLMGGLGAIGLFAIPGVNLLAPVVVTMAMVHACEGWRRSVRPEEPAAGKPA